MSSDFSILSDNDDLPIGWVITELENVCTVQGGYAFKSKDYTENGIPLVRISNLVENNNVDLDSNPIFLPESYRISHSNYCLREGDILIAMSGATTGKMAVFRCSLDALLNQRVGRFIIRDKTLVDKPYLSKLIENLSSKVAQKAYGGAQPNISPSEIERLLIPLPPLNEQRRIVEKVEALMARSHRAKEALDAIPKLIEQFRQSVLAAAFRGDLTADWREQNPNIETASVLLENNPQQKLFKEKNTNELPDPFPLPQEWTWKTLAEMCVSVTDGDHQAPPKADSGIPFLVISNINSGKFDFSNTRYVPESYYQSLQENKTPKKGDIVYSVVGSYGIPVLVETDTKFCFQRHIALLRPHEQVNSKYLLYVLKANFVMEQATEVATGTAQLTVTLTGLRKIKVPYVSFDEQIEIVKRIEALYLLIDQIELNYSQAMSSMSNLDQSILSKAFRGELVEQDPNDEPASVLLERIQKEREKEKAKVKQTGAKKLKK
jgi:type I restriction enzyme S subunit